ncbi:hypothetical protein SAMN02745857_01799 [Andreprevotia lacus DSM 23236]|jgi:hypothetical protein|uniref:Uncharacterized protein n=1 Tax=Andreprevotia lacus DSM 23236 TaxID=1121001 RepID=A0A1W1XJW5_9NEIS|nr:hypothetical protein [Andreprevotia lacus]SMC24269.1 hypothetical protein SAMN02745857_01799 [Andreprevotia lacus DSM 23236]
MLKAACKKRAHFDANSPRSDKRVKLSLSVMETDQLAATAAELGVKESLFAQTMYRMGLACFVPDRDDGVLPEALQRRCGHGHKAGAPVMANTLVHNGACHVA